MKKYMNLIAIIASIITLFIASPLNAKLMESPTESFAPPPLLDEEAEYNEYIAQLKTKLIQAAERGDIKEMRRLSAPLVQKFDIQKIKSGKIAREILRIKKAKRGDKYFDNPKAYIEQCEEQQRPIDQHMETIVSAFQVALLAATINGHEKAMMYLMNTYYKKFLSFNTAPSFDDAPAEIAYFMVKEKNPDLATALKAKLYKVSRWKEKKGSDEIPYLDQPHADGNGISFALSEAIFKAGAQTCKVVKDLAIYIIDNVDLTEAQLNEANGKLNVYRSQHYEIREHIQKKLDEIIKAAEARRKRWLRSKSSPLL